MPSGMTDVPNRFDTVIGTQPGFGCSGSLVVTTWFNRLIGFAALPPMLTFNDVPRLSSVPNNDTSWLPFGVAKRGLRPSKGRVDAGQVEGFDKLFFVGEL